MVAPDIMTPVIDKAKTGRQIKAMMKMRHVTVEDVRAGLSLGCAVRLSLARSVCCATTGFCRIVWRPERIGSYHTEQSPVHRRISCGCTGDFYH